RAERPRGTQRSRRGARPAGAARRGGGTVRGDAGAQPGAPERDAQSAVVAGAGATPEPRPLTNDTRHTTTTRFVSTAPPGRRKTGGVRTSGQEQFDALKCFEGPTPNPLRDSLSEQRFPHLPMFRLRMKPYAHNCRAE